MSDPVTAPGGFKYRPELDGLRAVAVLAVILNHSFEGLLPGGYLGVDVFFVLSGFVITLSLASRPSESFAHFLSGFYVRRIKRLVPALVLCVAVTAGLIWVVDPTPRVSLTTGALALFGASNLYLLAEATDYFGHAAVLNAFTHTWSLGVEEQFYFAFPVLAWVSGFASGKKGGKLALFWLLILGSLASLLSFLCLGLTRPAVAYFSMPTRFWELGAGCLLATSVITGQPFTRTERWGGALAVLLASALLMIFFIPRTGSAAPTIGVVLVTLSLIASLRSGGLSYIVLASRPAVYLGISAWPDDSPRRPIVSIRRTTPEERRVVQGSLEVDCAWLLCFPRNGSLRARSFEGSGALR